MNQFLQNFIQNPVEAERRGKIFITIVVVVATICTADFSAWSVPALDVEVLSKHQVFEGGVSGECWDDSQQVSIQACTQPDTHT